MIREPVTLVILLVATFITFLLWRRARRERIEAESRPDVERPAETSPVRYRLEPSTAADRRDVLRDENGDTLALSEADWEAHGIAVVTVRSGDSRSAVMRPGTEVWLEAVEDGAEAGIRVVSEDGSERLGDVAPEDVTFVRDALLHGDIVRAILLDEAARGAAARVLLIGWGVEVSI